MVERKIVKLSLVRNKRTRASAKTIKNDALESVKKSCEKLGDDIAGYALVMWAKTDGDPVVSYNADIGPIGPGLIVPFVMDALNREITVQMLADGGDDGSDEIEH